MNSVKILRSQKFNFLKINYLKKKKKVKLTPNWLRI